MPKFFVDKSKIYDNHIEITDTDAGHIAAVLRGRIGDEIIVCDGMGTDYICTLSEVSKKMVKAQIKESLKNENEPSVKITLYQGLPKSDKMELVIQKCVETGVDRIVPVKTDFTVVNLKGKEEKKVLRWNKISESAAKQCQRGKIPEVSEIMTFDEAIKDALKLDGAIIPYEKETKRSIREAAKGYTGKSIGVFIGPEGGFSEQEIKKALEADILSVTLGKRILRTETAGLVTSVILLYELEA